MTNNNNRGVPVRRVLGRALDGAMQWRLWVLAIGATLGCALVGSLPAWNWLSGVLDHSVHAGEIASGQAPTLLLDALLSSDAPMSLLREGSLVATVLMLLLSPLLAGAAVTASRSYERLGFGDLLRGGLSEYGPMLRMLVWSIIPLGVALLVMTMIIGGNEKAHEHAILASGAETGRNIAFVVGGLLFVLAHAGIEAGRGWLAADGRLRSALRAWWRGMRLLAKRPVAVLAVYLVTTLLGLLAAVALLWLRQHVSGAGLGGFLYGLLMSCGIAAALAWSRIARLFGMKALAEDMHARR
ncbi:MAG: hypothetical protein EOP93_01165 [Lysobacteraceae bacterium]|nr:MAG: hypothetical protein EOP93_01165 [Xanthomonadaceae bacterium]